MEKYKYKIEYSFGTRNVVEIYTGVLETTEQWDSFVNKKKEQWEDKDWIIYKNNVGIAVKISDINCITATKIKEERMNNE